MNTASFGWEEMSIHQHISALDLSPQMEAVFNNSYSNFFTCPTN